MLFPTDTILDVDSLLSVETRNTMKAIYLNNPRAEFMRMLGHSDTEIVNGMEELRVRGMISVLWDKKTGAVGIQTHHDAIDIDDDDYTPNNMNADPEGRTEPA